MRGKQEMYSWKILRCNCVMLSRSFGPKSLRYKESRRNLKANRNLFWTYDCTCKMPMLVGIQWLSVLLFCFIALFFVFCKWDSILLLEKEKKNKAALQRKTHDMARVPQLSAVFSFPIFPHEATTKWKQRSHDLMNDSSIGRVGKPPRFFCNTDTHRCC